MQDAIIVAPVLSMRFDDAHIFLKCKPRIGLGPVSSMRQPLSNYRIGSCVYILAQRTPCKNLQRGSTICKARLEIHRMTDFSDLLSLAEAAHLIPGRPSPVTLWRWHRKGCCGVRLQTVCIGARRFVSRAALEQFIAAVTAAHDTQCEPTCPIERSAATEKQLTEAGLSQPKRRGRPRKASVGR